MKRPDARELMEEVAFRRRAGPLAMARWLADRLTDGWRDRRFGISSAAVGRQDAALASAESVRYQPVSYRDMREILDGLVITEEDVFLDFGAGMGRAVCVAAMYPFGAVIGVEISRELCAGARRNVQRVASKRRCRAVRIVEADAVNYEIPQAVSVIFLFNPFSGGVLRRVLENMAQSLREKPRRVAVIFYGTVAGERFRAEAALHPILRLQSDTVLKTGARVLVYGVGNLPEETCL